MSIDPASPQPSFWLLVLSSSAVAAVINAVMQGLYNLRSQRNQYVNDYYKEVIKPRIVAYEHVEMLILRLKSTVVAPGDNRPYHVMFAVDLGDQDDPRVGLMAQGLWLSDGLFDKIREFDILLVGLEKGKEIEFGKKNYKQLATLRHELERMMARDMLTLHDVKAFLKSKDKPDPGFVPIRVEHPPSESPTEGRP